MNPNRNKILSTAFPELASQLRDVSSSEMMSKIFAGIKVMKGEKGDAGNDGYTPIKGKDYFTESDIFRFLKEVTPVKGRDYFDGKNGEPGKSIKGDKGDSIKGDPGKDGSPDSPKEIASKLNTLKGAVDASVIKGAVTDKEFSTTKDSIDKGMATIDGRIKLIDQRWHGGLSKVTHDATLSGSGTVSDPLTVIGGGGSGFTYTDENMGTGDDSTVLFLFTNAVTNTGGVQVFGYGGTGSCWKYIQGIDYNFAIVVGSPTRFGVSFIIPPLTGVKIFGSYA